MAKKNNIHKSSIIKDVVDDAVPMDKSLTRLFVLAKDLGNNEMCSWIDNELHGYKNREDVPDYRKTQSRNMRYSGINASFKVTNAALPPNFLSKELLSVVETIVETSDIVSVLKLASSPNGGVLDVSVLASHVYDNTNGLVRCTSIHQMVPPQFYSEICANVKTRVLNALLALEQEFGNLDNYGVPVTKRNQKRVRIINARLNHEILNMELPEPEKEPWYTKVAWNIVIPVFISVISTLVAAYFAILLNLQ